MTAVEGRHEREISLHRHRAAEYRLRYGPEFARLYQAHWNEVLLRMLPQGVTTVLDVGCGSGIMLEQLVGRYPEVTGVDLSPEMLSLVPPAVAESCRLICAPLESVDLPPSSFDAVICRGVLHHLPDLDGGLRRIHSLLRPGGCLVASEPCADSYLLRAPRWLWRSFSARFDRDHLALRSAHLRADLERVGFSMCDGRKLGFVAFPLCSMSDFLPIMRFLPWATPITRALIRLDEGLARLPVIRNESWHVVLRADRSTEPGPDRNPSSPDGPGRAARAGS